MSATSLPITPEAFLSALESLSLPQLHAESHRLLNSVYHLRRSNITLLSEDFSSDPDCQEAVRENEEVIHRQEERIAILRSEVERRGFRMEHGDLGEKLGGEAAGGLTNEVTNGNGRMGNGTVGRDGADVVGGESRVQGILYAAMEERDMGVVREVPPVASGVDEGQSVSEAVTSTEPPSQPREVDSVSHPAPIRGDDDGVYL